MMKAFFIICDQELQPEMDFLLRANHINQFSLFTHVQGKGESGLKTGDSIGPGLNYAYWIVIKETVASSFLKELKEFKTKKLKNKGIQVFVFPIEESF